MKKKGIVAILLAGTMLLGACGTNQNTGGTASNAGGDTQKSEADSAQGEANESKGEAGGSGEGMKVVYVTPGAMGDNGFCDSVGRGLDRLEADFGAKTTVIENNNDASKYAESL